MKIEAMGISNFRSIEEAVLRFGDHVVIKGPNGQGKTSILLALAWGLTGANSFTQSDGKRYDHLIRRGADRMTVGLTIANFGFIERRAGGGKSVELLLPDTGGTTAAKNDPILLDRLGVLREPLTACVDPRPFVQREPSRQRDILTRVLRPPEIKITPLMERNGIKQILGVEMLDRLIKEFQEVELRGVNNESRKLERNPKKKPAWPFKMTEEEIRQKFEARKAELEAALQHHAIIRENLQRFDQLKARGVPMFPILDEETLGAVQQTIADLSMQLAKSPAEDLRLKVVKANQKAIDLSTRCNEISANTVALQKAREAIGDPLECPMEAACPIRQEYDKKNAKKLADIDGQLQALSKAASEVSKQRQKAASAVEKASKAAKEQLEADNNTAGELEQAKQALVAHEAAVKAKADYFANNPPPEELDRMVKESNAKRAELEQEIGRLRGIITKAEQGMLRIAQYHREQREAVEYGQAVIRTLDRGKELRKLIDALKSTKEKIVGDKISEFLTVMNGFLEPLGISSVTYDWNDGFVCDEVPIAFESDGRANQFFEAAFRFAVAAATNMGLLVLDHKSPMSRGFEKALFPRLVVPALQSFVVYTTDEKRPAPKPFQTLWVEGGRVEDITGLTGQ